VSLQTWQETLTYQIAAGTLLNTFTTAKSIINPQAVYVMPPGFMSIGKILRVTAMLGVSNIVTTPGTMTYQVQVGPAVPATIAAFSTGAIQLNATAHTTLPVWLQILLTCRSVGSGTGCQLMGQGTIHGIMPTITAGQVDGVNTQAVLMAPATAPALGTGFDSTVANVLDFFGAFSISNAGNGMQVQQYMVESLN
jgi:hypothetical protein